MEGEDRVRSASLKAKLIGRLSHIFSTNKREEREVIKLENYHSSSRIDCQEDIYP